MSMPTPAQVRQLVAGLLERSGYDLEDVEQTRAGRHSVLRLLVSADTGPDLDALSRLSGEISELLDTADGADGSPYTLEVTTPGIDRPLTDARHWRRARGRKVRVQLSGGEPGAVEGRIGELADGTVAIIVPSKGGPVRQDVQLADVVEAVVQVEFSPPSPAELALAWANTELAAERPDK